MYSINFSAEIDQKLPVAAAKASCNVLSATTECNASLAFKKMTDIVLGITQRTVISVVCTQPLE